MAHFKWAKEFYRRLFDWFQRMGGSGRAISGKHGPEQPPEGNYTGCVRYGEATEDMKPSDKCIALIKSFESCRLESYQDQKGIWTCGWGQTGEDIKKGVCWSQEEADRKFEEHLSSVAKQVLHLLAGQPSQPHFDALVSFCYNVGYGSLRTSLLLHLFNLGNYEGSAEEFLKWCRTGDNRQVNSGLLRRRQAEKVLFESTV